MDRIKFLETERADYLQQRDGRSPATKELANQRKRIKTEFENEDHSNYDDSSKDELNAAFHSTSIDDDVVEPTQCQPIQSKSKTNSPFYGGHCYNEQNKENQNKSNLAANEKSPTVLSKNSKKIDVNLL